MLQVVLGLDAARIAAAFLVPAATMGQRLVRAKAKIRDAGIKFAVPGAEALPDRVASVLDAVYAAYGAAWTEETGAVATLTGLAGEAIYLARLVAGLLPTAPEAKGLLSLLLFCEARRGARRDAMGRFVPLSQQDATLWDAAMVGEADRLLTQAAQAGQFGRYQCEAAIQSVHSQRPVTGRLNHQALSLLYRMLVAYNPTVGSLVAQASALREAGDPAAALQALDQIGATSKLGYQPYWVTRAFCLKALNQPDQSQAAFRTAIELTEDPAIRAFLSTQ
jgi:RNA polymerase sigma-70 factor (ECF subfamily)